MPEHLAAALLALRWVLPAATALAGVRSATSSPGAPRPVPTARPGLNADDVSPGVAGFIATAAVVAACIVVIRSMVGRLRRLRHRADLEARAEAEGGEPLPLGTGERGLRGSDEEEPPRRDGGGT